jgi:NADP-dependent 3-hydroxy acid dehydrogenase YdfG
MDRPVTLLMGASRGIGAALAHAVADDGGALMLVARSRDALEALASDIRRKGGVVGTFVGDLSEPGIATEIVRQTLIRFGRIDHLVNNAAVIEPVQRLAQVDPLRWAGNLRTNVGSLYLNCQAVLPTMVAQSVGVIVNLSSGAAHRPVDGWSAYCASKAASLMLTQVLTLEVPDTVRIYAFQPGAVDTSMLDSVRQSGLSEYSQRPRETLLPPELPARVIAYLCRESPADLAGQELTIRDPELRQRVGLPDINYQ